VKTLHILLWTDGPAVYQQRFLSSVYVIVLVAAAVELLGLVTCAATSLLVSPVSWSHHYVYVVLALALAAYGPKRFGYRIAGVALIVVLFGFWPVPIGVDGGYDPTAQLLPRGLLRLAPNRDNNLEFSWRGLELTAGNVRIQANASA
jgi:alpha-1,2-mannosyltransferase